MAINSPWGLSQGPTHKITRGVVFIHTPSHGGLGVAKSTARKLLSDAALLCANYFNGYYWFEEDCQCCIAFLEHPEWSTKLGFSGTENDYKSSVDNSYPQYAEYLATNAKAPDAPVAGQKYKLLRALSKTMNVDDIVTVTEITNSNIVVSHPSAKCLYKFPIGYVLGMGYGSSRYLKLTD